MKRFIFILVLGCLLTRAAEAQLFRLDGSASNADRQSPHYLNVRNILRNHRTLKPEKNTGNNFGNGAISTAFLDILSDVIFERGVYSFKASLQGPEMDASLRKKRDGKWELHLTDPYSRQTKIYVLER